MGDIRTRKINQKHLNNIKMEEKIIYFMCLLMDLSILYEITEIYCIILLSLPSWERGLKFFKHGYLVMPCQVAPFVGAWIEMRVWCIRSGSIPSLPSWERGLKYEKIELTSIVSCRSLRGSVD